jgi:hypothetical protein
VTIPPTGHGAVRAALKATGSTKLPSQVTKVLDTKPLSLRILQHNIVIGRGWKNMCSARQSLNHLKQHFSLVLSNTVLIRVTYWRVARLARA